MRLSALTQSPRETYDEVVNKLLELLPRGDAEGRYTAAFQAGLRNARLDNLRGRVAGNDAVKQRLGR